jgi:hypothetical protein
MQHTSQILDFYLDPSKPSQGKENEDLTILKDVDLAKAAAILKDCEALIGNKLSRPKPSQPTFSENNYYKFLILKQHLLASQLKLFKLLPLQIMNTCFQNTFDRKLELLKLHASNVHGKTSSLLNGESVLFKNGQQLSSKTQPECLQNFY